MENDMKTRANATNNVLPKLIATVMASIAAVFSFAAAAPAEAAELASSGGKILIIYYSRSGNTRDMAQIIHKRLGGDMVELKTVNPYPEAYRATTEQARRELDSGYLPPLATRIDNIASYDTIVIGSPNWWGTQAMPVRTFLSENNLAGKTVTQFITHEGSGLGRSMDDLRRFCPNATILEGLAVRGSNAASSQRDVDAWLRKIGLMR